MCVCVWEWVEVFGSLWVCSVWEWCVYKCEAYEFKRKIMNHCFPVNVANMY